MAKRRRIILKLFVFLLAGAILSYAIALLCLEQSLHSTNTQFGLTESTWQRVEQLGYPRKSAESGDVWQNEWRGFGVRGHESSYRVKFVQQQTVQPPMTNLIVSPWGVIRCGLPFPCLFGERSIRHDVAEFWVEPNPLLYEGGGISIILDNRSGHSAPSPSTPLWLGLIADSIFWAMVLWLMFIAPFIMRRWWRSTHNRCVKCNYDLKGHTAGERTCPECGMQVPVVRRNAVHGAAAPCNPRPPTPTAESR